MEVLEQIARTAHQKHEFRALTQRMKPYRAWNDLTDEQREEFYRFAKHAHDALTTHPDGDTQVLHMCTAYGLEPDDVLTEYFTKRLVEVTHLVENKAHT